MLSRVTVLVDRTHKPSQTAQELAATLKERLRSMSETHALLSRSQRSNISLKQIFSTEVRLYDQGGNVSIDGPDVLLNAQAAQAFSNAIHELTTNAIKHGALSTAGGRVAVQMARGSDDDLTVTWKETGGPRVTPPTAKSFGLRTIEEQLPYEFEGRVEVTFAPDGFAASIAVPMEKIVAKG